ncbi:MAG: hypothetical protein JO347_04240, partial [Candidatus Eremiobacteraeota bacterium]|nr:hypothetical protein [Candidatus Eremiobacteraeota bacterium]
MHDADDVIDIAFVDGDLRIALFDRQIDARRYRTVRIGSHDVDARRHHFAHRRVAQLED